MATIKDIAAKAGVSTATVSHVINGTRFVSERLTERIKRAIEELDYHPNAIARSLVKQKTHTIGVIISDIRNPFYTAVVRGVEDATYASGYNVILCNTDENPEKETLYIHLLLEKRVDGIAIATSFQERIHPQLTNLTQIPLVTIVRKMRGLKCDAVYADNVGGSYKAIEHLISLGHRRIGIISGPPGLSTGNERLKGCLKALAAHRIRAHDEWMMTGDFKRESGYVLTKEMLGRKERPTALFAANNQMALGALQAFHESDLRAPRDLSLVSIDDAEWSAYLEPALTVVDQSPYLMGNKAGRMLLGRIIKRRKSFKTAVIPSTLIRRRSSGPPQSA